MSSQQLSKIWTLVSLFLLYYAVNTYLATQGGLPIFGANLVMTARMPAAFLGIPICAVALLVASLIGLDNARKEGPAWADRIPLVGFEKINSAAIDAKLYQAFMLFLLTVLPVVALAHFWSVIWGASVATTGNERHSVRGGIWDSNGFQWLFDNPASICNNIVDPSKVDCQNPATIVPGLEPALFALLTLSALFATACFWCGVFLPRRPRRKRHD